jgi:aspartate racemase
MIIDTYRTQSKGNAPEIIIHSLNLNDFPDINERDKVIAWFAEALYALHKAGAEFAVIAANTPHVVFDDLKQLSPIPLVSIVEETCRTAKNLDLKKVGLLGTKVTMSSGFYSQVFSQDNITVIVPTPQEQGYINNKLFTEIMYNKIVDSTREGLLKIVKRMIDDDGIEGLILGCTELPLILTRDEFGIPFLNTTKIHVDSVVRYCLSGE